MNNSNQAVRVALFFILGIAILWVLAVSLGEAKIGTSNAYVLKASFNNLLQLKPGDEVRMAGVHVGNVSETVLEKGRGIALLDVDESFTIPKDSVATIAAVGLLGNSYVSIKYGSSMSNLQDGQEISTYDTADLNAVISQLGDIGKRIDGFLVNLETMMGGASDSDQGSLFSNLNQLITSNKENLDVTLSNLRKLTTKVADGEGSLGKFINDDDAYDSLMGTAGQVKKAATDASLLLNDTNSVIAKLKEGRGTLGVLLTDDKLAEDLRVSLKNIHDFTSKLNSEKSTLGRLISNDDLYLEAQGTLKKVNVAIDSMNDSGPISAVGAAASALF